MLKNWYKNYSHLMKKTSFISKFGALTVVVASLVDFFRVVNAYRFAENYTSQAIFEALLFPIVLLILFGLRFYLLMSEKRSSVIINSITWLVGAAALYVYAAQSYLPAFWRDDSGVSRGMYYLFNDPLLMIAFLFLVFSSVRFVSTFLIAFSDQNNNEL